jgi:transcriptional regulator with XRE-family HTH domain
MSGVRGTVPPGRSELGNALRSKRREKGLSLRDLAAETGVSFNTLSRVERGFVPDLKNYERIVDWLGLPVGTFLESEKPNSNDTTEVIAQHLFADRRLSPSDAGAIVELVREMYSKLASPSPPLTVHLRSAQTFRQDAGNLLAEMLGDMQRALEREQQDRA